MKRHGMHKTRTYKSWDSAIRRCHWTGDPTYSKYGAVGITVCQEWRDSFMAFHAHMGERPAGATLDRIDNTKGYEPGNCRWATPVEQARNRRSTKYVTVGTDRVGFMDACEKAGLPAGTVRARLRCGFSIEEALALPLFKGGDRTQWRMSCAQT